MEMTDDNVWTLEMTDDNVWTLETADDNVKNNSCTACVFRFQNTTIVVICGSLNFSLRYSPILHFGLGTPLAQNMLSFYVK